MRRRRRGARGEKIDFSVLDLIRLLEASKEIVFAGRWVPGSQGFQRYSASVVMDRVVAAGVSFVATCHQDRPDERVALMLMQEWKGKARPFARAEWRAARHDNNHPACGELHMSSAGRTHFHDTRLHDIFDISELFSGNHDLPVARKIDPEPSSLHEFLETASVLLHIENLRELPLPPWQASGLHL